MTAFVNIHGSGSPTADSAMLERTHRFVEAFVEAHLRSGGGIVAYLSAEPRHPQSGVPLVFDWIVAVHASRCLRAQGADTKRLHLVALEDSRDRRFPVDRLEAFREILDGHAFTHVEYLQETGGHGARIREAIAATAHGVVAVSGGRGVLAMLADQRQEVSLLPMDVDIGSSLVEPQPGACALYKSALTRPGHLFRFRPEDIQTRLPALRLSDPESDPIAVAHAALSLFRPELAERVKSRESKIPRRKEGTMPLSVSKEALEIERIRPWVSLSQRDYLVDVEQLRDTELLQIRQRVEWFGLCLIRPHGEATDVALMHALARSFGPLTTSQNDFVGSVKEIVPRPGVKANTGDSALELGPHVDGTQTAEQPELLVFQYVRGGDYGGHSTFWDMAHVFLELDPTRLHGFLVAMAHPHAGLFEKNGLRYEGPLVRLNETRGIMVRARVDDVVEPHLDVAEAHGYFKSRVAQRGIEFLPRRGDLVIFDNGRIAHGRGPVGGENVRAHRRMWIERLHPELRAEIRLGVRGVAAATIAAIESMLNRGAA